MITAFLVASVIAFFIFWVASQLAEIVEQPHDEHNDFTVGQKMMLCDRVVDTRHKVSGYDFDEWQGARCDSLSKLDECILDCLAEAGTIDIGAACYSRCVSR